MTLQSGNTTAVRFWATVTRGLCGTAALGGERSRAVVCALAASAEASIFPRMGPGLVSPHGEKPPPRIPATLSGRALR